MKAEKVMSTLKNKSEGGFALLEYTVGAAVILTVLYVAFNAFAGQLDGLFKSLGDWATARSAQIPR